MTDIESIDLAEVLTDAQRKLVTEFCSTFLWHGWPADRWVWPFGDVCALYMRLHYYHWHFHRSTTDDELRLALLMAIKAYMSDEYA